MHSQQNPFAALGGVDESPRSSVFTCVDTDAIAEISKPDVFWMDDGLWCLPDGHHSSAQLREELTRFDSTPVKVGTFLGFDTEMQPFRPADVVRTSPHSPEESSGYLMAGDGGQVAFGHIIQHLLKQRQDFEGAQTVYLIVDSRLPKDVDFWPAFQPWWQSRVQLIGRHRETTRLCWFQITSGSGVEFIPRIWAGVFVLLVARFLFPSIHIALVDTDCVPISLYEIQDLVMLSQLELSAHSTNTPPGGVSPHAPVAPGMLLFSEQFHDINAGLVISLGDPKAAKVGERLLMAERDSLLTSSSPKQPPTTMFRQGTLLTPFLGIQCKTPWFGLYKAFCSQERTMLTHLACDLPFTTVSAVINRVPRVH